MALAMPAHRTLRFAVTAASLKSSMEDIVNLLAGNMAGRHQVINACLRFRTPQCQSCCKSHAEE
ncbi:MAG: hypothetical protein NTW45_01390 [Rhodocyclales bacterium]|nr:hypothetical protein [Rhodocyclales bacterium]